MGQASAPGEAVRRADEPVENARFVKCVPCVRDEVEFSLFPSLVKLPGGSCRRADVVAALHDDTGNAAEAAGIAKELAFLEPCAMNEVVVLDSGKGRRERISGVGLGKSGIAQQCDGFGFPAAPRLGGSKRDRGIRARQPAAIGSEQVATLFLGDGLEEAFPLVRKQPGGTLLIKPEDLGAADGEYTP